MHINWKFRNILSNYSYLKRNHNINWKILQIGIKPKLVFIANFLSLNKCVRKKKKAEKSRNQKNKGKLNPKTIGQNNKENGNKHIIEKNQQN